MPIRARGLCLLLLMATASFTGCTAPPQGNLLKNPGFESGDEGWFFLEGREDWVGFEVTETQLQSGDRSLRTVIDVASVGNHSLVAGAIQELSSEAMGGVLPARLAGSYRVENWDTDLELTYVQIVIGLFPGEDSEAVCPGIPRTAPCQLAYILTGVDDGPLPLVNRRYVIAGPSEPSVGQWIPFDFELPDHFRQAWGVEPGRFDRAWIYFEARYDVAREGEGARSVQVEVLWDDLYLGS